MQPFRGTKWYYESTNKVEPKSHFTEPKMKPSPGSIKQKKNGDKMVLNSTELMSKLEKFSDVWNDCPNVGLYNPISKSETNSNDLEIVENKKKRFKTSETTESSRHENRLYKKDKKLSFDCGVEDLKLSPKTRQEKTENSDLKQSNLLQPNSKTGKDNQQMKNAQKKNADKLINKDICHHSAFEDKYDAKKADVKRKKAVEEQIKLHEDQKNIVKQALSCLDGKNKLNTKIVFDKEESDSEDETKSEDDILKPKRQKLFDDENEDDTAKLDIDVDFKLNHKFGGKKGEKLLELQSKFASDSRFALDKRFYESGSEEEDEDAETPQEETSLNDEKAKQLAILESIVKQPIRPLAEIKKKSTKRLDDKVLLRFDPTREDHMKYLQNQEPKNEEKTVEKKVKKKKREEKVVEEAKPVVSTEKFVAVKKDLKEVLSKDTGFSLLNLFGPKDTDDDNEPTELAGNIKKTKHATKNPFKYDSSDSEPEEEAKDEKTDTIGKSKPVTWSSTFFFTENDPRLQEAFEFLKRPEEGENKSEFAEKRKFLKDFVKNKYKNSLRKNSSFKKKLGGLKKNNKSFNKKKIKSR